MVTIKTQPGSQLMTRQEIASPVRLPDGENHTGTWVQTERAAHEAWSRLVMANGRAAALLHLLVAKMGERNAVVVSRGTLASLMGCSEATVKRAVRDLREDRWIETVSLGGKGGVNAYVVNCKVAWQQDRNQKHLAVFDATIVASRDEQEPESLQDTSVLREIPTVRPGELQLPTGPGEEPPSQPSLYGLEPDLPAVGGATAQSTPAVSNPMPAGTALPQWSPELQERYHQLLERQLEELAHKTATEIANRSGNSA